MKKISLLLITSILFLVSLSFTPNSASAQKVMWGDMELKRGQIGKVTLLRSTPYFNRGDVGMVGELEAGSVFRVYSFTKDDYDTPFLDLGGNVLIIKDPNPSLPGYKYETPSKALLERANAPIKVMWGKTELKKGQIGKVTVNKPINLWKRVNNELQFERILNPGEEYRVYKYDQQFGGQYGLGGGYYVTKIDTHIKYETPSRAKLKLLN